jgi:RNA polymerase sigma-70 factor (ECF subfamily)
VGKSDQEKYLSAMSDDQLLEALQKKRDLKAFQILYDRMSPKIRAWVWTYSRRYGFTRSEEDDVYSDVTLRIAKSTRAYDPALGNASCYLYGLTRHAVFNFLRDKTRHRMRPLEEVDLRDRKSSEQGLPEVTNALCRGLARLDARGRKVILLRVGEGRSLKEIASALKMTVPQARMCCHHAVARLRDMLAHNGNVLSNRRAMRGDGRALVPSSSVRRP